METVHLRGKQLALFDETLMRVLDLRPCTEKLIHRQRLRIGVRNETGELYRVIGTSNVNWFQEMIDILEVLGFKDVPQDEDSATEKYNAIVDRQAR